MTVRRVDPDRRDRIIDAALDVLADHGVAGTTHRKVASRADVPLGSMTYHFDSMNELLHEAFTRFAASVIAQFEARLGAARTLDEARAAVAEIIHTDVFSSTRELVLTHELYTLAARVPAYRAITREWMRRSRQALERHFDSVTAAQLDALIEGLTIHQALDTQPHDKANTIDAIARITAASTAAEAPR